MFRRNKERSENIEVIQIDSPSHVNNSNRRMNRRSNRSTNRNEDVEIIDIDDINYEEIAEFINNDDAYIPPPSNSHDNDDLEEQDSPRRRYPLRSRNNRNSTQPERINRRRNTSRNRTTRSRRRSRSNLNNFTHSSPQPYTLHWWLQQIEVDDIPNIDIDSYEGRLLLDELIEKKGLEEYEINQLPVIKHEKESSYDKECAICLDEYKVGDELIVLYCIHVFHKKCISRWLEENKTCPACRKHVLGEDS